MTIEQILEIIERYELRIPPTAYYDLKADIVNCSEIPTGSTTKSDLGVDAVSRKAVINQIFYSTDNSGDVVLGSALRERIARLPSVTPQLSSELEKNSKKLEKDFGESDCISRADARKAIIDHQYSNNFCEEHNIDHSINTSMALIALSDLPSVTPQEPRWIPVSEKLPEPFTFVNATCRSLVDDRENWVVETLYLPIPKEVNKHGYSDWGNIPMLNWGDAEVIAWVERIIPQPYKVEIEPQESEGDA